MLFSEPYLLCLSKRGDSSRCPGECQWEQWPHVPAVSQYLLESAFSTLIVSAFSFVVPAWVEGCTVTAPCWEQGPVCIRANDSLMEDCIWCIPVICNVFEPFHPALLRHCTTRQCPGLCRKLAAPSWEGQNLPSLRGWIIAALFHKLRLVWCVLRSWIRAGLCKQVQSHCLNGFAPDYTRGGLAHSPPISSSFDCKFTSGVCFCSTGPISLVCAADY